MYHLMLEIKILKRILKDKVRRLLKFLGWSKKDACSCECENPEHPEPSNPPQVMAHGFAYSIAENNEGGTVPLRIAGPLQDAELTSDGIVVLTGGIYQIQYAVSVKVTDEVISPARFQIIINDLIRVDSSVTETFTSQQLTSVQLFSLLEGDIVKLAAELPQGMNYLGTLKNI